MRGLRCPLPALLTKRALRRAAPGTRIAILADDPLASLDVPNAARESGGVVLDAGVDGGATRFLIERSAPA